jgi:hypothetical protein
MAEPQGELLLGDHEAARRLGRLGISPTPLAVFSYPGHPQHPPGWPADRPGAGVPRGTPPLNQYATPVLAEQ